MPPSLLGSYGMGSERKEKKTKENQKVRGEGESHQSVCRAGRLPAGQQNSGLPEKGLQLLESETGSRHRLAA